MKVKLTIPICDTGDNHPIYYELTSDSDGFHLIDFKDITFGNKVTFSYRVLDYVIEALRMLRENETAN